MNGFQVFFLGLGVVVLTVSVVGIWWFTSRTTSMKLPGVPRNGWVLIIILTAGIVVDLLLGKPVWNFTTDAYTVDGEPRVWLWALSIAVLLGLVLAFFQKRAGTDLLQGIIIASIIVATVTFVLNKFGSAPDTSVARGCTSAPFGLSHIIGEQKDFVLLDAGRRYTIRVPEGRERDFRIEFADTPLPSQESLELGDIKDFLTIAYYGDGTELSYGLSTGFVRVKTDAGTYRRRVNNQCLGYYVYLASG